MIDLTAGPARRRMPWLMALLLAALLRPGAARAQSAPAIPQQIDAAVAAYQARSGVPGVAVAVTQGDRVIHLAGYGHDSQGRPLTPQTPLPIASLSKSFTAFAVMQLAERGEIELDAPVRAYLPEFQLADPRGAAITIRQLLSHRSGMADQTFAEKRLAPPDSLAAAVASLRTAPLLSDPGAEYHYHNPNYWVAARLVEVVSGMPFNAYLTERIFAPLDMAGTRSVASLRAVPELAEGYVRLYGRFVARAEPAWFLDGASGIVTSAADLAPWLLLNANAGRAPDGTQLLSPQGVAALHAGLGWHQDQADDGRAQSQHSGWLFTFTAHQLLLPGEGYGVAVMTNTGLSLSGADSSIILAAISAILRGEAPPAPFPAGYVIDGGLALLTIGTLWGGLRALRRQ
ncbi:MAG TPA: serine hydrolase domain-containing protein, partial [Herpetosiphonaceae bacterium]